EVLGDVELSALLSDEGSISEPRYPTNDLPPIPTKANSSTTAIASKPLPASTNFPITNSFGEQITSFTLEPEVKILINAPEQKCISGSKKVLLSPKDQTPEHKSKPAKPLLILYALPNGNTAEQTIGKVIKPGEDWHYDIQHIAAQIRFLRQVS